MTKRDFFILFIKITGLFLLLSNVFTAFPALFSYGSFMAGWQVVLLSLATVVIIVGLFILLVQKADRLVDWLNLTKGFDDDLIELGNPNKTTLVQLVILLIGGYLLIINVPEIIVELIYLFQTTVNQFELDLFAQDNSPTYLLVNSIEALIGYLLLTNSHRLALWLASRSKSPEEVD